MTYTSMGAIHYVLCFVDVGGSVLKHIQCLHKAELFARTISGRFAYLWPLMEVIQIRVINRCRW